MSRFSDRILTRYNGSADFIKKWKSFEGDKGRQKKLLESVANHNYKLLQDMKAKPQISYKYNFNDFLKEINPRLQYIVPQQGTVTFEDLTTDGAIKKYAGLGGQVIALNFANGYHVGGNYTGGSRAQEEDLCRQYPRLFMSLTYANEQLGLYPVHLDNVLITHDIERLREDKEQGYEEVRYIDTKAGFITAAAPNMNNIHYKGKTFDDLKTDLMKMFELIFTTPKFSGKEYNVLIVGCIGMGAFAPHDPVESLAYRTNMANLIAKFVNHYRVLYKVICVAVPNKNGENYQIFKKASEGIEGIVIT